MAKRSQQVVGGVGGVGGETEVPADWPAKLDGRQVVLHTRVVTDTGGGPDKTILMSAPFMADSDYWLTAAYMHPPDDPGFEAVRARAAEIGSPLIGVPDRGPLDRTVLRQMLRICKHYSVRIWHGHDYKSNLLGLMLRPFWPMKLVTTVHGWVKHTTRTPLYYAVDRWSLPYYHHVICVSDDLVERVGLMGVPADRRSLIPNAIDHAVFQRRYPSCESPMRQELGVPQGRLVVGAVGRLSAEKAFNNLIKAAHSLVTDAKRPLDIEVWIAGDGDARGELERLIERLGMTDRVRLLGFCGDTIGLYHALDAYVLSSLREGLPNVVLEAAAMGVPLVSTRVAGVPKMITDGEHGLLCPVGDVGALAGAMRRVLGDRDLADRLATNARCLIEQRYSFKDRMTKVRAIYDRVLGVSQGDPLERGPGASGVANHQPA